MVDLTPSNEGYISMLKFIIRESQNNEDVEWCKNQLKKAGVDFKCCVENPIDDFSTICQECYDEFRVHSRGEEE